MIPKTEAIVLKSFDYRETSRIATFFTKDYGKISGILKGIRKDHKKFGSSIDKYSVNDLVYYHYRNTDLHLIGQCDLKKFYFNIRQDYKRNIAANYSLELVDIIMQPSQVNRKVYQLLLDYLEALGGIKDIDKLVHIFQVKILQNSGFNPHLDSCVVTGRKIDHRSRFSVVLGGLVASGVKTEEKSFHIVSPGAISTMMHIQRSNWQEALKLGMTAPIKRELKFILNNFLVYHLERKIKSAKYL